MVLLLWKTVPQIIKHKINTDNSNFTSIYISKRNKSSDLSKYWHTYVYDSIIHNSKEMESTQMPINGWLDKQIMAYPYNRTLLNLNKEGNLHNCYNMDGSWRHYVNWNKPDKKGHIFYDSTNIKFPK